MKNSKKRLQKLGNVSTKILDAIKLSVDSGDYRKELLKTGFAYEKSKMGPGFVDKVFADESRVTGRVVNGEFVELTSKSQKPKLPNGAIETPATNNEMSQRTIKWGNIEIRYRSKFDQELDEVLLTENGNCIFHMELLAHDEFFYSLQGDKGEIKVYLHAEAPIKASLVYETNEERQEERNFHEERKARGIVGPAGSVLSEAETAWLLHKVSMKTASVNQPRPVLEPDDKEFWQRGSHPDGRLKKTIKVIPVFPRLICQVDDGCVYELDMSWAWADGKKGTLSEPLMKKEFFDKVFVSANGEIRWENGFDISPQYPAQLGRRI